MNGPLSRRQSPAVSTAPRSFALVSFVPESDHSSGIQAVVGEASNRDTRGLSADQAELGQICDALKVRRADFAVLLGIGLPRLSSYLYGRTASVPSSVMQRARELRTERPPERREQDRRLDKPMSRIAASWAKRLGTSTDVELADLLGVTTMTVYRWKTDEVKPDMTALVRYDRVVQKLAAGVLGRAAK